MDTVLDPPEDLSLSVYRHESLNVSSLAGGLTNSRHHRTETLHKESYESTLSISVRCDING
jgi:hypothetical protein